MGQEIKKLIRKYKNKGFIFKNGSKHIIAIHKLTKRKVIIARTPSDVRAIKNICNMMDKAMFSCEWEMKYE